MTEKEQNRSKVKIWLSCHRESAPYENEAIEAVMQADSCRSFCRAVRRIGIWHSAPTSIVSF